MPSYPRQSTPLPIPSTSTTAPPPFPWMTTRSDRVYPQNQFKANAADCLHCLQMVPEERLRGTAAFPNVVEDSNAEDNIFQQYYHWFINKGQD